MGISENNAREGCTLPLVCICIPTYNAAVTVHETLQSILHQTYLNLVVHISDNASTDETLQIIEEIKDSRITVHRNLENVGGEANFNRCIQLAEGKYTAIFHADDVYEPDMVERQVAVLEAHSEAGAVFTDASLIDERGNRIGEIRLPKGITSQNGLYDFSTMFKAVLRHSNFFICPSVMVRTKVYKQEIKCWRGELFKSSADLDLWLRILRQHPIGYLPERLMRYRISDHQWSARVRLGTERADFFLVIDHYLAQEQVRALLDATDLNNYRWLDRRDRVMRATNLFITGFPKQANELAHDIFSRDALTAVYKSKRGAMVFILGVFVKLLVVMNLNSLGRASLAYMKHVARK
ncbi:glycosyltransferase [Rhodoferax sp.]|uniref:glycosyltransferase family 2 protein n=1 Tax=Rhodoferax sp. TaxID=50421 RepID=UPI002732F452|nr:glycosyltransferase [Rhodoferax sp.]MDP3192344.1 glycosyltransferase [Rhodoferax sp.]